MRSINKEELQAVYSNEHILQSEYYLKEQTVKTLYLLGLFIFIGPGLLYIGLKEPKILQYSLLSVPIGTMMLFWAIHQHKKRKEMPDRSYGIATDDEIQLDIPFRKGPREGLFQKTLKRKNIQYLAICFEQPDLRSSFPYRYVENQSQLNQVDCIYFIAERRFQRMIIHPIALDSFEDPAAFVDFFAKSNIQLKFAPVVFRFENELERNQYFVKDDAFIPFQMNPTIHSRRQRDMWDKHLGTYIHQWHKQYPQLHTS